MIHPQIHIHMKGGNSAITLMTEGSIAKKIVFFALPLFWGNLFQQLYNVADTLIVGNTLGNDALGAVASSGNLIFLMISLFSGIGMGSGVVVARYFGAGDRARLKKAMHTAVAFALVCGFALTVLAEILAPQILRLIGTPPEILPKSLVYFRVYFLGSVGFILFNFLMGILESLGDSRHPVMFLAFSSISNVFLDLLFVAVLKMGVGGAALATILTQAMSALLCLRQLMKNPPEYRLYLRELRIDRTMLKLIASNGIPAGIQNSIIAIANVFVQSNINAFGRMAVAGCGSYAKIEGFAFIPVMCFSQAISTFVSQNIGAGKGKRAFKGAVFGAVCSITVAEIIGLTIYALAPRLIGAFGGEPEAVAIGITQSHIGPLFYFLLAFSHCMAAVMRGAGKSFIPMFVMMFVWCFLRVGYITFAVRFFPVITTVFWAYPLTWSISSVIFLIIFLRGKWMGAAATA